METPKDRKYSKEHEWLTDDGIIGITEHAQHALTDIVFVELPLKGKKVEIGKPFCVIESVKSVSDVFSPVDGEVIEVNEALSDHPELINEDCYGKGWIAKVRIAKADGSLMSAEEYDKLTG